MAYDYPGSCAPSRWLPSAPKQKLERGPFGLAHRVPRASPMRAASGCLPPAVRIIPQYVPGFQPRIGACCQSRAIYYQQKLAYARHEKIRKEERQYYSRGKARKGARRSSGWGGEVRAKEGCGTNPVLCWAGLPDCLQTERVENGIITAEGVSAAVDDRQSYIRRTDRGGQRRA